MMVSFLPGSEVFEFVFQGDALGNGDTILGNFGSTKGLFNDDVSAFWAESYRDSFGEDINTGEHSSPTIV
jgi:hypothetical protein